MDVDAFETDVRCHLPRSFSGEHLRLMLICFGNVKPDAREVHSLNDHLDSIDMDRLYHMVQVEFAASLAKEKKGSDTTVVIGDDYNPYDVYLVHATMDQSSKAGGQNVAIVLPRRNRKEFAWYNGGNELLELDQLRPKWKIASLSGPSRVLEALNTPIESDTLSHWAMRREMIQPVERNRQVLESFDQLGIQHLNVSQQQAVATVASPKFKTGFFCVQGSPGTGKTTAAVSMIHMATLRGRVLVTAPSNSAVGNIALKVF
jgi:hypothetical protein